MLTSVSIEQTEVLVHSGLLLCTVGNYENSLQLIYVGRIRSSECKVGFVPGTSDKRKLDYESRQCGNKPN